MRPRRDGYLLFRGRTGSFLHWTMGAAQRGTSMKSHLAIATAVLAVTACMPREVVTAKLVDSRPGSSLTGVTNTICTYRYNDVRGQHQVEKIHAKDAKCPSTIEVER